MNNPELQRAWQIIENTGTHLFLTGKAGTGKTTFLRNLKKESPKRTVIVAPTGIAAINAGGVTIHSFFQLPFAPFIPDTTFNTEQKHFQFSKEKINIIRSMDLLIIDEISMVRADLLDAIDSVLRRYRDQYKPFGGVQLLMIGDLQQLAPVVKETEWNMLSHYYDTSYFFGSLTLKKTTYATIELKQVYRQNDPYFLSLLNKVRENKADEQTLAELNQRYIPNFHPVKEKGYIQLTTHNYQAQQINDHELSLIKEPVFSYKAEVTGIFPEYSYPTDETLMLKKGAQIMFVKNDPSPEKRYYNGMIGEITSIDEDRFTVRTKEKNEKIIVQPEEWTNSKYVLNEETKEITEEQEGVFKQYPVKLAWGITIHKSQGLTFEHAIIDARSAFAHGQAYVALSRCKTLEGMVLSSPLSVNAIISDTIIDDYNQYIETHTPNEELLHAMQQAYFLNLVSELFDFSPIARSFNEQARLIDEHFYKLFPQLLAEYKKQIQIFTTEIVDVSYRFHKQYERLVTQSTDYNTNNDLQIRIIKGAAYFEQKLRPFHKLAEATNLPTDNKELRKKTNNTLEEFLNTLTQKLSLLQYVEDNGFHASDYLRKKAYILLSETDNKNSSGTTAHDRKERTPREHASRERKRIEVPNDILHPELYRKITEWRGTKAKETGMPAYVIIQQKALLGMVNLLPNDAESLEAVPYFGRKGVENYGLELLGIIRNYMKEQNLQRPEIRTVFVPRENKKNKEDTKKVSFRLFKEGMKVKEIAEFRELTTGTISNHLLHYVRTGDIKLQELVDQEKINYITAHLQKLSSLPQGVKEIKEKLGEYASYDEIRFVFEAYKKHIPA